MKSPNSLSAPRVRALAGGDLPRARELFARFPYKIAQRRAQRLDPVRLVDFYWNGLRKAYEAGQPHWAVESGGRPAALAGLADNAWHTEIFGLKMARVQPWLNTDQPAVGPALLHVVEAYAREHGFEHLSVRVDGEDFANLHLFEAAGWRLVDVSLKFSLAMPLGQRVCPPGARPWIVGVAEPADRPWIRRLGSTTHGATHFLNDPALAREKTYELFARWLDRCFDRLAYRIYTLKEASGRGVGFVTYLKNTSFSAAVGRAPLILDFVLLDPEARGGGTGPWFIEESLAREGESGFDYCELRTSAHNLPAVACYEKLGFRCCASDFVLDKLL